MLSSAQKCLGSLGFFTNSARSLTAIAAAFAFALQASPAVAAGDVVIGVSTTLSGPISQLGQTGLHGIQSAVDAINAHGGLLGKTIRVVTADDGMSPATGTTNVRQMILSDHAVAIFGPVSSAVGAAEETLAGQYRTPYFLFTSNDVKMTTSSFTPYAFQVVPNTVMEPRAVARYLADQVGSKPITIATITPNYSFGRDSVDSFLQALKTYGVTFKVVAQEYPKLGETDYTPYIPALVSAHADYTFVGEYGGDLITLTKQAVGFGLFKQSTVIGQYGRLALKTLPNEVPGGTIGFDRAPFWAMTGPGMDAFINDYHAKYGEWPSAWAIMGYTAVQTWAQGVTRAKDFAGEKVAAALSGATVETIRGPITLRSCDHQGDVAEYVGTIAATADPRFGHQIYDTTKAVPADQVMLTCAEAQALQPKH